MENINEEKLRTELSRVQSPSSVSSVHSIRPLEWDSGADIGYQHGLQSGLSTVERIALVSGTVNLLETCKTHKVLDISYREHKFSNPVAHSSPFLANFEAQNKNILSDNNNKCDKKPLVNYSVSSDSSFDEKKASVIKSPSSSRSNTKINYTVPQNTPIKKVSSKSLEDLRCINSRRIRKLISKSRSSHNIFVNPNHKTFDEKNNQSSSSIATVLSYVGKSLNSVSDSECKYLNKGVQVDESSLNLQFCDEEYSHYFQNNKKFKKPNIEFFKNLYQNGNKTEYNSYRNYPTYTIDDGCKFLQFLNNCSYKSNYLISQNEKNYTVSESCQSNVESLEGDSFEYVPGSVYGGNRSKQNSFSETNKESSSEVNSLCTEVVDGVDLVTRYVNNLQVSNKCKIIKKMAQFLINNADNECNPAYKEKAGKCLMKNASSNSVFNSSPEVEIRSLSYEFPNTTESSSGIKTSESPNDTDDCISKFDGGNFKSLNSSNVNEKNKSRKITKNVNNLTNSNSFQSSVPVQTTISSYTYNSDSHLIPCKKRISKDLNTVSARSLKHYLEKERDVQLLWIKSGIDHLNNLKKLYESQQNLKSSLINLKKLSNTEVTSSTLSERDLQKTKLNQESRKISSSSPLCKKSRIKYMSSDLTKKLYRKNESEHTSSKNSVNNSKIPKKSPSKNQKEDKNDCNCNCKCNCKFCGHFNDLSDLSENKENISEFMKISNQWQKYKEAKKSINVTHGKSKEPISYTVVFGNEPTFFSRQNFTIKEQTVKKSLSKICSKRSRQQKTPKSKFQTVESDMKELLTLQEYLSKNKPDYIQRAEIRRQCLSEIARLREIRDKSRDELLTRINPNESDVIQCTVPPPPLSVLRIFNDKSIRRQTEKKYQQLPEVQNKKLELKRKENYRKNQIMAQVFTKKLQKKVLRGQVNLSNTANVIST